MNETAKQILDAAATVVRQQGLANITIDAVAKEAGLSKGGVFHYFKSKRELLAGMVQRIADDWNHMIELAEKQAPPGPARMTRWWLENCLADPAVWTAELGASSAAIFAALAFDPALIEPIRNVYTRLSQLLRNDGLPEGTWEIVLGTLDGMWLWMVLGVNQLDERQVVGIRTALQRILTETKTHNSPSDGDDK